MRIDQTFNLPTFETSQTSSFTLPQAGTTGGATSDMTTPTTNLPSGTLISQCRGTRCGGTDPAVTDDTPPEVRFGQSLVNNDPSRLVLGRNASTGLIDEVVYHEEFTPSELAGANIQDIRLHTHTGNVLIQTPEGRQPASEDVRAGLRSEITEMGQTALDAVNGANGREAGTAVRPEDAQAFQNADFDEDGTINAGEAGTAMLVMSGEARGRGPYLHVDGRFEPGDLQRGIDHPQRTEFVGNMVYDNLFGQP